MVVNTNLRFARVARRAVARTVAFSTFLAAAGMAQAANFGFDSGLAGWNIDSGNEVDVINSPGDPCAGVLAYANIACDPGEVIAVITGDKMVRLGDPKRSSESQDQTPLTITSDLFTPASDSMTLAARLFSYEFRGDDQFVVEVLNDSGIPHPVVNINLDFGGTGSCNDNPCVVDIDIGKRSNKRPFDSASLNSSLNGAVDIAISNLPLAEEVQIRYTLNPSSNSSHPTWIYLDNRNSPPMAVIEFGPGDPNLPVSASVSTPAAALEGDFVAANCAASTDPEGDPLICNWKAWGGGLDATEADPLEQLDTENAVFYFPDSTCNQGSPSQVCAGEAFIELTVDDGQAPPQTLLVGVNLVNAQPLVGATNLEVLEGTIGTTVCRFADTGIGVYDGANLVMPELDESCVPALDPSCSVSGVDMGGLTVVEKRVEHDAEFASGFAIGEFDATSESPGTVGSSCTITDKDSGSGSAAFTVTILTAAQVATREPAAGNDSVGQVDPQVVGSCDITGACARAGSNYLAALESPEDVDVTVLRNANGDAFPPNSVLLVSVEVPTDYDFMIVAKLDQGLVSAPFAGSARISAPFFGSTFNSAPFFGSSFNQAPFFNSSFNRAPFFGSGFSAAADPVAAPFFGSTFQPAPFFSSGFTRAGVQSPTASPFYGSGFSPAAGLDQVLSFDTLPLTSVGLALPSADGISGNDIDLSDSGGLFTKIQGEENLNLQVVDISANLSTGSEALMLKTTGNVLEYYAVVFSSYGAYSAAPYSLRVETSEPPSQEVLWANTDYCNKDTTFRTDPEGGPGDYPAGTGGTGAFGSATTLVLSQKERFETVHPGSDWDQLVAMVTAASEGSVAVVSVPPDWYADADESPCQVSTRNDLLQRIKDAYIVKPDPADADKTVFRSPNLEYIVVLGDRSVFPAYSVLDNALVGNESDYATQLPTMPGTWASTAVAEGYNSTYAFLADKEGTAFEGDFLWVEDVAVGVLAGDPGTVAEHGPLRQELVAGAPATQNSVVTGYEAFADSAQNNADLLSAQNVLIDPDDNPNPWSAQDLRNIYDNGVSCTVPLSVVNLQTHMTPSLLWSSQGYRDGDFTDTVSATEPKNCVDGSTTTLSLGCHSAFEVPKLQAQPGADGDWIDELGSFIGPIGYGLGDKFVADRVTEGLLTDTLQLALDNPSVGLASNMVQAKQDYMLRVADFDAHDADAMMVLTAFMLPNQVLGSGGGAALASLQANAALAAACTGPLSGGGVLDVTLYQNGTPTAPTDPAYTCLDAGTFGEYEVLANGGASGAYKRPLLPFTYGIQGHSITAAEPFNDVLLVSRNQPGVARANLLDRCPDGLGGLTRPCRIAAEFQDTASVDPVFSFPETNWSQPPDDLSGAFAQLEQDACVPNLAPFPPSAFNTAFDQQTQIIRGAQFRCEEELSNQEPGGVRGTYRRFDSMHLDALQANTDGTGNPAAVDTNPPEALLLEFSADPETNDVLARLAAKDAGTGGSGICELAVLVYFEDVDGSGGGIVESYSTRYDTSPTYTGGAVIPDNTIVEFNLEQARGNRLSGQLCDCDGNCTYKTLKGGLLVALDVQIVSLIVVPGQLQIMVENYANLEAPTLTLEICPPVGACTEYLYDLLDLPYGGNPGNPPLQILGPDSNGNVTLTIDGLANSGDSATATVRSGGSFGTDTATLTACEDPIGDTSFPNSDIASCGISRQGGEVAYDMVLVSDGPLQGVLDEDVKYRMVFVDYGIQVQYFQGSNGLLGKKKKPGGKLSGGPSGWGNAGDVAPITDGGPGGPVRGLRFFFSDAELQSMGWSGSGPTRVEFGTQSGVAGSPSEGHPDETIVFELVPPLQ